MKKIAIAAACLLATCLAGAQQKQGKVTYQRTVQMQMRFADNNEEMERMIPKVSTDQFELSFGNNQSIWKHVEEDEGGTEDIENGGVHIRMVMAGTDDVLYNNFDNLTRVELRELMDKKFIVDDSIHPLKWKMGEETKSILNHVCHKASAVNYTTRMLMNVDNGKMERKEIQDTLNVTAWFTSDIPVSAGPAEYQGQLPGLILAIDVNNGRQVYLATQISDKADLAEIKAPQGKKHYTPEEFRKESTKMMNEMENNNGGGRQIRIRQ